MSNQATVTTTEAGLHEILEVQPSLPPEIGAIPRPPRKTEADFPDRNGEHKAYGWNMACDAYELFVSDLMGKVAHYKASSVAVTNARDVLQARCLALEAKLRAYSARGLSPVLTESELEAVDALLGDSTEPEAK